MITKFKKIEYLIALGAIALILVHTINSNVSMKYFLAIAKPRGLVGDELLIPALTIISSFVPKNETLVASGASGAIQYFADYPVKTPREVDSQDSLVQYMSKNNFRHLVVVKIGEKATTVEAQEHLFTDEGLKRLEYDFQKIVAFKTEFGAIYLYKIKLVYGSKII